MDRIKGLIQRHYGILNLLDLIAEADRLVGFTRFFTHSGTKEVRSRDTLRPLLLLDLFAEGTNTGIKRVATVNPHYGYDELLYVRKHYLSVEALRNANGAVVNKILALRNPQLWGEGHACASDGKRFESWRQNLMTEWRSRYKGYGILVYWHVETNAVCIYSQLRNFSFSEVAAMIEGLIRHDTEMRVEKNFVDSHGQSEVAFAFCHLLGGVRLMPRLKRLKYERLYVPDKGMAGAFPNLAGVLSRPIRWDLIAQQYDEMVKHAVALKTGTATAEAILKRFNSYNVTHPTYKALADLGKVEKTIYLCEYLSSVDLRHEVEAGLNVVERWNEANDFLCYGRQGVLATNNREQQGDDCWLFPPHYRGKCVGMRTPSAKTKSDRLHTVITDTLKLWRRHHLTYDQTRYVAKEVRCALALARPPTRHRVLTRLSRAEEERLIGQAYRMPGVRGLLIKTLFQTGARVSEFVHAQVPDVYFDEQMLLITHAKGGKQRYVPLLPDLTHELRTYLRDRATGYLFETTRHTRYSPRRIQQLVQETAALAGITKRVYPHLLRHSVATALLERGMPLEQIQQFLGHAKLETTQVYAASMTAMIKESYQKALTR